MMIDITPRANRQPIFNIPPVTKALLIANVAVHVIRMLLPRHLDAALVSTFAFIPARYTLPGAVRWPTLVDPLTYQFLHGNLMHLGMNMLALLAFGAGVERRLGGWRMLVFALICGVASAALHLIGYPASLDPVIGASGAISGLFGAVLWFRVKGGMGRAGEMWLLIALWVVMDIVSGLSGIGGEGAPVAWVAHIGGFLAGLLLFDFFDRTAARAGIGAE
jgi:membrane associated rhomboid family serine protease